jgi:hypothetical protein
MDVYQALDGIALRKALKQHSPSLSG